MGNDQLSPISAAPDEILAILAVPYSGRHRWITPISVIRPSPTATPGPIPRPRYPLRWRPSRTACRTGLGWVDEAVRGPQRSQELTKSQSMTAQPYPTYLAHSPYQNTLDAPGPAGSRLDPRGSMTFSSRIRSVSAEGDMERHPRSSSEERDSLTPAQSRRKAQNRAA